MGWRFRKVFSAGLMRVSLSRGGVGWSVGIPGLRYGVSATGRRYVSFGVPGFGVYWMKYLSGSGLSHQTQGPQPIPAPTPPVGRIGGASAGGPSLGSPSAGVPSTNALVGTTSPAGSSSRQPWWKQGRP